MGKKKQPDKTKRPLKYKKEDEASYRKSKFFSDFKAEAAFIRDELVRELPMYNMLLSLQCESFDDVALRVIAKQRGTTYDPLNPPVPDCPDCKQRDKVGGKGKQGYFCNRCNKTFRAYHNSIVSDKKISDLLFMQVVTAILEGCGQTKTCKMTGVSPTTYLRIRNKVFYALQILLADVKLTGVTQADCSFVRVSYKGLDLEESEFDEGSIFYDSTAFIPREARKRGGSFKMSERNANSLCILSLIDEYGKSRNVVCGTGLASLKTFKMFVPDGLIQKTVPESEPFILLKKPKNKPERKPGDPSLLVIDGELALENYAKFIGVEFESHVYRKNGVQRALPKGSHDIQKINALHSRLKKFLRARPISSKYLPGYLLLFDALDMTAGSKEMKERVLEIMATPGLGQPPEFYQQMFSVPNYLEQWFAGDHALKKLPYHQLLAFYLYDHIRSKELYPDVNMTLRYIREACGYSDKHIRANYQNLLNAGYRDLILSYFGEVVHSKNNPSKPIGNIPSIIPILHDEWAAYVRGEKGLRPTFTKFAQDKIKQHNLPYTVSKLDYWFKRIEVLGICNPIPPREDWVPVMPNIPPEILALYDEWNDILRKESVPRPTVAQFYREKVAQCGLKISYSSLKQHFDNIQALKLRDPLHGSKHSQDNASPRNKAISYEYESLLEEQKQLGNSVMNPATIRQQLGKKYGLSPYSIYAIIRDVRNEQKAYATTDSPKSPPTFAGASSARAPRSKTDGGAMTLLEFNPAAAARWHPTKNEGLTPDQVTYGSAKRVWWLCPECGYEWETSVRVRSRNLKCPMCEDLVAGRVADNKNLAAQWHPTKNELPTPGEITLGSKKKAWWICDKGHEWEISIIQRAQGSGCPFCSNKKVLKGFNDLGSRFPAIAIQWHPNKNKPLDPEKVMYGSGKSFWWLCPDCGHEWKTAIRNRTRLKSGCPHCAKEARSSPKDKP